MREWTAKSALSLLLECESDCNQKYKIMEKKKIHQMGFDFKMQILFEELHKGILPLISGEKSTLQS